MLCCAVEVPMELEFAQLDLRYEGLRARRPERERRLLASLAEAGQQVPVVVVPPSEGEAPGRHVLVDGYKRVRALRQLKHDTVTAFVWTLGEAEALLLDRLMRTGETDTALEQGWLLVELAHRFGLSLEELARRFDRSKSWVSRRLGLVAELPATVQEPVRRGELPADAAARYLVPLARANRADCERLVTGIAGRRLSSREVGALYAAYRDGNRTTRERLLADPFLFLRARPDASGRSPATRSPVQQLQEQFERMGQGARGALRLVRERVVERLLPEEQAEASASLWQAEEAVQQLLRLLPEELRRDARREATDGHPGAGRQGTRCADHRPGNEGLPGDGAAGAGGRHECGATDRPAREGGGPPG